MVAVTIWSDFWIICRVWIGTDKSSPIWNNLSLTEVNNRLYKSHLRLELRNGLKNHWPANTGSRVTGTMNILVIQHWCEAHWKQGSSISVQFSSVQSLSRVWLFATPWTPASQASLSITNSRSPTKPMSTDSVMQSNYLILCHPLLLLPSIFLSIRIFSSELGLRIKVVKVLEFQLQHQSLQWTPRTDLPSDGLFGSPHRPRDSQESSPTPQFKSISSSVLIFLYSPNLTPIHDHWKNHSLD